MTVNQPISASGYRALLALPVPRRLALASVPADFADWLDYAAVVALLVFSWNEGPLTLALFALALTLPYVIVGPFVALVVDRTPLVGVLVASNLGRGLATLGLAFAGATPLVLLLVFVRSSIDSAFTPARQAAIQASTPSGLLGSANGLHQAINQTSKVMGPAAGGLLLAFMPVQGVFALNALLSLIAAAIVWRLRFPARVAVTTPEPLWTALTAGIAEFRRSRLLATALAFASVAYFAFFLYDALIALLADEFGLSATAFGISIAASGAGGLVGSLLAGALAERYPLGTMFVPAVFAGAVTSGVSLTAIAGLALPDLPFFAVLALMGGATAFMLVPYRTLIQRQTPPDRLARTFAAGEAVTMVVMLSAPLVGSLIASIYGTAAAFLCGGVLLFALGGLGLIALLSGRLTP